MSKGKVALGTMAGLAIGAVAGVLFAPEKGSTTRKKIVDKSGSYLDGLKSKISKAGSSVTEKFSSTKNEAEGLVDGGKEKYNDVKKDVKSAASSYNQSGASNKY